MYAFASACKCLDIFKAENQSWPCTTKTGTWLPSSTRTGSKQRAIGWILPLTWMRSEPKTNASVEHFSWKTRLGWLRNMVRLLHCKSFSPRRISRQNVAPMIQFGSWPIQMFQTLRFLICWIYNGCSVFFFEELYQYLALGPCVIAVLSAPHVPDPEAGLQNTHKHIFNFNTWYITRIHKTVLGFPN